MGVRIHGLASILVGGLMQTTTIRRTAWYSATTRIALRKALTLACLLLPLLAQSADTRAPPSEPANVSKPAQQTPPFPREGTDLETSIREQQEYMQWWYENNENVVTILVKLKPEVDGSPSKPSRTRGRARDTLASNAFFIFSSPLLVEKNSG